MATLTFHKSNNELIKYVIRQDTTTIGRSSGADICLPDNNISREHFVVSVVNGKFLITDKSTNGTLLNGQPVVSRELQDGDRISAGDWEVVFTSESGTVTQRLTAVEGRDPTEVVAFDPQSHSLSTRQAILEFVGNKGKPFVIAKDLVSIGKAASNDLRIVSDTFVSSYHCKVENRRGQYFLKDLQSTNGTFLNKQQVVETSLHDNALLTVGKTDLKFYFKEKKEIVKPSQQSSFHGIIGKTVVMRELFALIEKVSKSDVSVMIQGETGVGKDVFARAIHELSPRSSRKMVTLNCSAIAKDLIESELFGHEKGAFTSAHQQRKGAFEEANGGTLFLDELGDMPLELQPKLLRVLENREIKRVGSNQLIDVDVRVIAATHQDLAKMVKAGRFREDLYFRLFVIPILIRPLRERVEDIPLLCEHFLKDGSSAGGPMAFTSAALEALMGYSWPGNVRELKNVIARAVLKAEGSKIDVDDLSFAPVALKESTRLEVKENSGAGNIPGSFDQRTVKTLKDFEKEKILQELLKNNWNKKKTAESLGIAKTTLFEKIKKYNLKP